MQLEEMKTKVPAWPPAIPVELQKEINDTDLQSCSKEQPLRSTLKPVVFLSVSPTLPLLVHFL